MKRMKKWLVAIIFTLLVGTSYAQGIVGVKDGSTTCWGPWQLIFGGVVCNADGTATISPLVTVVATDTTTATIDAVYMRGHTHRVTGAAVLSLPTAAVGYNGCFVSTTAAVVSLDVVTATDIIILNGVSLTAGFKATSDGSINATICVEAIEAGYYRANAVLGVWSDGGS